MKFVKKITWDPLGPSTHEFERGFPNYPGQPKSTMDPRDYQGPARNTTQDKLMQIYHQMRRWRLAGRAMRTVGILAKAGQAGQGGLPR